MVLNFRGTAHPCPGRSDPDVANLSAAEIAVTNMGYGNVPVLYEHNNNDVIGRVDASWESSAGELRVAGVISNPVIENRIRSGKSQGLSLGTDCIQTSGGKALVKSQAELSVCEVPRRPGCFIDVIDNEKIRSRRNFSNGALIDKLCSRG